MSHRPRRPAAVRAVLPLLVLLLAGCSGLKQPYPARRLFGLPVALPAPSATSAVAPAPRPGAIRIEPVRILPPFNGTSLVYQVGPDRFEIDYYRAFVADPAVLLTSATVTELSAAPGFLAPVLPPSSGAGAAWRLESSVLRFVGDFSDEARPVARVTVRFFLLRNESGMTAVAGDWTLEAAEPLASDSADDLPAALGRAYGDVLAELVARTAGVR